MIRPINYLSFIVTTLTLALAVSAQDEMSVETRDPGAFYGFWEFQEPAGDSCIVVIKRGGRLSCFWAGTSTRAIQKGKWERTGDTLTANWEAGHVEVFSMLGDNAIERSTFNAGQSLLGAPALTLRGVRIDSRIPGSLTIKNEGPPPMREMEEQPEVRSAIPINNDYIGYWKVDQSGGIFGLGGGEPNFYLHLNRNGKVSVALREWEGDQGVRGLWMVEGSRAIVTWPNNRRDVVRPDGKGGFVLETYRRKDDIDGKPRSRSEATKVNGLEASRYFEAGGFNKLTVVDIRGKWSPLESTGKQEYISVEGWGNAYRYPASDGGGGTDPGKWRLANDRINITWIDGTKDVIRISFPDFIQDSYTAAEPFTGTPFRSVKVMRSTEEDQ